MEINDEQLAMVNDQVKRMEKSDKFYGKKLR